MSSDKYRYEPRTNLQRHTLARLFRNGKDALDPYGLIDTMNDVEEEAILIDFFVTDFVMVT